MTEYCAEGYERCKGVRVDITEFCYAIDATVNSMNEFFHSFPVIDVLIGDMIIEWNPVEYLINEAANPWKFCLGVESQV